MLIQTKFCTILPLLTNIAFDENERMSNLRILFVGYLCSRRRSNAFCKALKNGEKISPFPTPFISSHWSTYPLSLTFKKAVLATLRIQFYCPTGFAPNRCHLETSQATSYPDSQVPIDQKSLALFLHLCLRNYR